MRRRDLIALIAGSAAAWPLDTLAQVRPVAVIGFLGFQTADPKVLAKFHEGLNKWGYFEGRNLAIEYEWASDVQQVSALATKLVQRRVALIVASGGMAIARAAKEATATIPILFSTVGVDPVENGVVASFNRPGGNVTGLSQSYKELIPKRLELLKEILPRASKVGYLQNDDATGLGPSERTQIETETNIASELGLVIHYARSEIAIEAAFAAMAQQHTEALLVASDPLFGHQRALIVGLAQRYALPAGYSRREFADAGGLMSYGPSITEAWGQIG
jgi:putative ABC transport system substrate-binding protein